jgi:uncharacterized protein
VCELLLRGPQTPGELRSRASRMAPFTDVSQVETALEALAAREDGPFVARLAREPGRRESRYAQLFTGAVAAEASAARIPEVVAEASHGDSLEARVTELERVVKELRAEIQSLRGGS